MLMDNLGILSPTTIPGPSCSSFSSLQKSCQFLAAFFHLGATNRDLANPSRNWQVYSGIRNFTLEFGISHRNSGFHAVIRSIHSGIRNFTLEFGISHRNSGFHTVIRSIHSAIRHFTPQFSVQQSKLLLNAIMLPYWLEPRVQGSLHHRLSQLVQQSIFTNKIFWSLSI
jgi:hypothetical protein